MTMPAPRIKVPMYKHLSPVDEALDEAATVKIRTFVLTAFDEGIAKYVEEWAEERKRT